jgi:hypothetical protein
MDIRLRPDEARILRCDASIGSGNPLPAAKIKGLFFVESCWPDPGLEVRLALGRAFIAFLNGVVF